MTDSHVEGADVRAISGDVLNRPMPPPDRRVGIDRQVKRRHREAVRSFGRDALRLRTDAGATHGQVADVAGIDRSHYTRVEAGLANASLKTMVAISVALGADITIRLYPGTGPRLTDRHQARMLEVLLRSLHRVWRPHIEVPVSRPSRGVIDAVLERGPGGLLVATEVYSELRRLEQQIRWSAEKAGSLGSSDIVGNGPEPVTSRLLVLRSTTTTRQLARQFEATLHAAYPAATSAVLASLLDGAPWPGPGIVWVRIEGERVELLDAPPRGVTLGR